MNNMTERDAYMILQEVKELDDSMYAYSKDYNEALEMALSALKKQIPMKPKKKILAEGWTFYICPTCKCVYGEGNLSRYCGYCGQKIDWSKENERTQD